MDILNKKSGLLGISVISNDFRQLSQARKSGNKKARLAIDIFIYRIKKYIGSYIISLGGIDAIIFTAGIGENAKEVRDRVTEGISKLLKNKPKILVIPTNEELMIARQTYQILKTQSGKNKKRGRIYAKNNV